jgi:hypothetical protein
MYLEGFSSVIPAKAGIHASLEPTPSHPWMPAFAGMTGMRHVRSAIEATRSCPVTYARLYIGRVSRIQNEMAAIGEQLAAAFGRGGQPRRAASAVERARVNVRNSIATALTRIHRHDEALWRHLSNAIRTGTVCSYRPDRAVPWQF